MMLNNTNGYDMDDPNLDCSEDTPCGDCDWCEENGHVECNGDCGGQCEQCFEEAIDRADRLYDQMRDEEMGL